MRLLAAGLVLIAIGIGLAEWLRRNPEAASGTEKPRAAAPATLSASMQTLLATGTPSAEAAVDAPAFAEAVNALVASSAADGFVARLQGTCSVRALASGPDFAVVALTVKGLSGLVRVPADGPPTVLAARPTAASALAVDADTVWWAEAGQLLRVGPDGVVANVVAFSSAAVVSLAAHNKELVAALVPREGDPFSTEPTGAVVRVHGTAVSLVMGEVVRPHDAMLVGDDVFFVAGYPSGLQRASLDGAFSSKIAERADGPIAFDGDGVVHRFPQASAPEVRRVARAGGSLVTLSRGDADWLTAGGGLTSFTSTGIGARLFQVKPGADATELLKLNGTPRGLALLGGRVVVAVGGDEGVCRVLVGQPRP